MIFTVEITDGKGRVTKQTYEGFASAYSQSMKHPAVLAVVIHEGEADFWRIDSKDIKHGIEELERYYRTEWGYEARVIIYTRDDIESHA